MQWVSERAQHARASSAYDICRASAWIVCHMLDHSKGDPLFEAEIHRKADARLAQMCYCGSQVG